MDKKIFGISLAGMLTVPTLIAAQLVKKEGDVDTSLKMSFPAGKLNTTLETVANYVIGILVLVAVFYIIRAGYEFVTANGEAEKIDTARKSIMYAAIGIIIALLAKGIVNFVIGAMQGGGGATGGNNGVY